LDSYIKKKVDIQFGNRLFFLDFGAIFVVMSIVFVFWWPFIDLFVFFGAENYLCGSERFLVHVFLKECIEIIYDSE